MGSKRRLELEEEGRASGRIPREKEKEKNKFDAVETRSELTNVYKYANGPVADARLRSAVGRGVT
eukprot:scaffold4995_cov117-Isochrysis_galbana.AAC.4